MQNQAVMIIECSNKNEILFDNSLIFASKKLNLMLIPRFITLLCYVIFGSVQSLVTRNQNTFIFIFYNFLF